MSDIPAGYYQRDSYFLNGVELLEFRREPYLYPQQPKHKKKFRRGNGKGSVKRSLHARDGGLCHYCQVLMALSEPGGRHFPQEMTVEHVVPKVSGGSNLQSNLVLACYKCNSEFGDQYIKCHCGFCQLARSVR